MVFVLLRRRNSFFDSVVQLLPEKCWIEDEEEDIVVVEVNIIVIVYNSLKVYYSLLTSVFSSL